MGNMALAKKLFRLDNFGQMFAGDLDYSSCTFNATAQELAGLSMIKSEFYQRVMVAIAKFNKVRQSEGIRTEPLWNNTNIRYKTKPLFFKSWGNAGLCFMQDLWVNGKMMPVEEMERQVGARANLLFEYNALTNAILRVW